MFLRNNQVFSMVCLLAAVACSAGPRTLRAEREEAASTEGEADEQLYSVVASHVLVAYAGASRADSGVTRNKQEAQDRAVAVLARAQQGEDFSALAQEFSDGPSGPAGGSLGSFTRSQMVTPFSDAAFSLEPGEVFASVVETEFGFHVIRRDK